MNNDNWLKELFKNPLVTIAAGIGVGFVLAGLGWALSQIIQGIVVAIGVAGAILSGTIAIGTAVSSWVIPVATYGLAVSTVSFSTVYVTRIIRDVSKKPYEWLVPVLGVFSGFLVNLSRDFFFGDQLTKIVFASLSALLIIVGGVLFKLKGVYYKIGGSLVIFGPPLFILISSLLLTESDNLQEAFSRIHWANWVSIIGLVVVAILILVLAEKANPQQ